MLLGAQVEDLGKKGELRLKVCWIILVCLFVLGSHSPNLFLIVDKLS